MKEMKSKKGKRMTKRVSGGVTNKEFLRAWCEVARSGDGLNAVALKTGLSYSATYDRYTKVCYLLGGLGLPELRGQRRALREAREIQAVLIEEAQKDVE